MTRYGRAGVRGGSGFLLPVAAALLLGIALPGCKEDTEWDLRPFIMEAMVSPDGDYLAVARYDWRGSPLYIVNLATGDLQTVPRATPLDWRPHSAQTQRLTCVRYPLPERLPSYCEIGLDGSDHALSGIPPDVARLKWSPDGHRAVYAQTVWHGQRCTAQLWVWQDGERTLVCEGASLGFYSTVWAVDGRHILACDVGGRARAARVVQVDVISGQIEVLLHGAVGMLRASADGRFLFCLARREGDRDPPRGEVWRVATDGAAEAQAVGPPGALDIVGFDCSPDGTRAAMADEEGQLWYGDVGTGEYSRIDEAGYSPVFLDANSVLFFRKSDNTESASTLVLCHDLGSAVTRQVAELQWTGEAHQGKASTEKRPTGGDAG